MMEDSQHSLFLRLVWPTTFWVFLIIKIWGVTFASWSWWWVLLPVVPTFWALLGRVGLLQ